ncbi:MAG: hypothetical protein JXR78_10455 [Victivallales bacterium]|nr:hypothetical protein [Victivallales bacterium]
MKLFTGIILLACSMTVWADGFSLELRQPLEVRQIELLDAGSSAEAMIVPRMKTPPAIDGIWNKKKWAGALKAEDFKIIHQHALRQAIMKSADGDTVAWLPKTSIPRDAVTARLACDDNYIYVAVHVESRNPKGLKSAPSSARDAAIHGGDSVDVFIRPGRGTEQYYHFIGDWRGALYDAKHTFSSTGKWTADTTCNAADISYRASVDDRGWTAEFRIPFKSIGMSGHDGEALAVNIGSASQADKEYSAWNQTRKSFHEVDRFRHLSIATEPAKALRFSSIKVPEFLLYGNNNISVGIKNPEKSGLSSISGRVIKNGKADAAAIKQQIGKDNAAELSISIADAAPVSIQLELCDAGKLVERISVPLTVAVPLEIPGAETRELSSGNRTLRLPVHIRVAKNTIMKSSLLLEIFDEQSQKKTEKVLPFSKSGEYLLSVDVSDLDTSKKYRLKCSIIHNDSTREVIASKEIEIIKHQDAFDEKDY